MNRYIDRNVKNNPNYNRGCFYELISPEGIIGYTNKLVTFCQNNNLSRIKNTLYNYLKKDLKSVMEFDFEF